MSYVQSKVMGRDLLATTFMLQELHKNCIRNETFLFVKIDLYDKGFCETSQNFIYPS